MTNLPSHSQRFPIPSATANTHTSQLSLEEVPRHSRFVARWLQADSTRRAELEQTARLSLSTAIFAQLLQKEISAGKTVVSALRRVRNLVMASLISRDLCGVADLDEVLATVSELAEFIVRTHLASLMPEMIKLHGTPMGEDSAERQELIVLGMGKLGGRELNVSSDIDLIFCYAEDGETVTEHTDQRSLSNHEFFSRLGKKLIAAISEVTEDGFSFRVDMALRPNGASGPLVASFAMLEEYFLIQGREWERYAWVKARPLTGIATQIQSLDKIIQAFVYRRYLDYGVIDSLRAMHSQIRAEVIRQETRHPEKNTNIKLGRGGIREVEFLSQVFQLIRGGRDPSLRDRSTRKTLMRLGEKGILKQKIVKKLLTSYSFLRNLEHRLQYVDDAQTHTLPRSDDDQLNIARMMGYQSTTELLTHLAPHRQFVADQFDAIFKEKDDAPINALMPTNLNDADSAEFIESHLQSLGLHDAQEAMRRLLRTWQSPRMQSLAEGSRNKLLALVNTALRQIGQQTEGQLATINRLLDFMEAIARRSAYLSLLTEFPHALERVVRMMSASNWAATFLTRHPILLDELLDESILHQAPDWASFTHDLQLQLEQQNGDSERQMDTLREMHHIQLFRLLAQDLEGSLTVEALADALSLLADTMVAVTIQTVWESIATRHQKTPYFAVIAYGKLGGKELGYASDLDVIFLYDDPHPDAPSAYAKLAQRFITWMTAHTSAGILFDIDVALRPDGASGLMVSSIDAFERYQEKSAWVWEHQALTRARFCAGYAPIAERFNAVRERVLRVPRELNHLRTEVMSMRKKMHEAHPNRSLDFDLKHDSGGMIDIEFIVQYLILQHAHRFPELTKNTGNIALLKRCGELGLIPVNAANAAADAYRVLRKLQHNIRLQGEEKERVAHEKIASETLATKELWQLLFAPHDEA
ncbi:MAG: bifunctional [glutamate--ammonia ligase]-adenylyl-L-tyrosine phosphorylase/[glutamate--ammonia-ligase] adenylyltransferase [Burkholderiaceae bacterium]|nr:bifunctional [glutamate--ammonia ligase]-adenylyl-L-tyrosine phosphorylase/[glutamate--ammonia-ligase] adenylyltransferase [Burkholderiaceae bacterium]